MVLIEENKERTLRLVINSLDGDMDSFELLTSLYLSSVYRLSFYLLKNKQDAEDNTQETFIKVWSKLKKFNKQKNFSTWILSIARNNAIDILRKKKDSDIPDEDFKEIIASDEVSLPAMMQKTDDEDRMRTIILSLPEIYREIISLRYEEELSFEEIAEITKTSANTLKSRHKRALTLIKAKLP